MKETDINFLLRINFFTNREEPGTSMLHQIGEKSVFLLRVRIVQNQGISCTTRRFKADCQIGCEE